MRDSAVCIYLGPHPTSVGYLLWDPQKNKTFDTLSCLFDEYSTGICSLKERYVDDRSKQPRMHKVDYEDEEMDFSDMDSKFKPVEGQLPIFKYERGIQKLPSNPPLPPVLSDTPDIQQPTNPNPPPTTPPEIPNLPPPQQEEPPFSNPKEKEEVTPENIQLLPSPLDPELPTPGKLRSCKLGEGPYWKNLSDTMIMTTENGTTVKRSSCLKVKASLDYKNLSANVEIHEANSLTTNEYFEDKCVEMLPQLSANLAIALQASQESEHCHTAVKCEDSQEWIKATVQEINTHLTNGTWTLVPPEVINKTDDKRHVKANSVWSYWIKMKNGE